MIVGHDKEHEKSECVEEKKITDEKNIYVHILNEKKKKYKGDKR